MRGVAKRGRQLRFFYVHTKRHACYLVCKDAACSPAVARGIAAWLPQPVRLFSFAGDYLLPHAGEFLIAALLNGESVVLLCRGETALGRSLVEKWPAVEGNPSDLELQ